MKRTAILLLVADVMDWVGSRMVPPSEPISAASASSPSTRQLEAKAPQPEKSISAAEKKAQQEKWFGAETIVAAKRAVRASLKNPDSAQFKGVYANYTEAFGVVACGQFNAKNGYGAYTGFKRFVSSGKSVIIEGQDNLANAWRGAC